MGIKTSKALRERIGGRTFGRHWRPPLGTPLPGFVWMALRIEPPTVTHHAKHLAPVGKKGGGWRMTLADDPALVAAREQYLLSIPERPVPLVPLRPPIVLHLWFYWHRSSPDGQHCHTVKPDASNATKALEDVLSLRGYWDDDAEISDLVVHKRWTSTPGCVLVYARTLAGPTDPGNRIDPTEDQAPYLVHPVPWLVRQDLQALGQAFAAARAIEKLGNLPGERKPSNPKRVQPWQTLAKGSRQDRPGGSPAAPRATKGPGGGGTEGGKRQNRSGRAKP